VHPAPLITKAPVSIRAKISSGGSDPGAVAKAAPQPQGQNRSHVPNETCKMIIQEI